jgi:NDP-sugar pyrophosphorylase family protein
MVLAAGLGLRMRPLTLLRAKPVLPVLNRPLLHWTLELLARHGVRHVIVNLHHLPRTVTAAVGDGSAFGLEVTYSRERTILGTGGGPRRVRELLGDEPFLLVNGDVVFDFDLTQLVARHRASGARATLALKPNPDPKRYGPVVTGADGRILSLAGRPRRARGRVSLFTGVQILEPALLDRLPRGRPSDTVRDLYAPLVAAGEPLLGVRVRGAWYDLGSPRAYLESQRALLAAAARGGRGRTLVDPGARLAPGVRIGASIVGSGAVIGEGASILRSVVWDGVRVGRGARIEGAIVAADVRAHESVRGRVVVPGKRVTIA